MIDSTPVYCYKPSERLLNQIRAFARAYRGEMDYNRAPSTKVSGERA